MTRSRFSARRRPPRHEPSEAPKFENRVKSYARSEPCIYVRLGDHEFCFARHDVGDEEWDVELGRFAVEYVHGTSTAIVVHEAEVLMDRLTLMDLAFDRAFDALDAGETYVREDRV